MEVKKLKYLLLCNILGILLFGSWYLTEFHGFWFEIDKTIFFFLIIG